MTNTVTTTEHHLSKSLEKKADAIAVRVSSVEKEMEQICMDVATDCEELEEETAYAYLKRAFPEVTDRSNRNRFLRAGLFLHECGRRRPQSMPNWSTAAEAYALPPAGHKWFFSEEKPPTRQQIRDWKKHNKPKKEGKGKTDVTQFINSFDDLYTTPPENNVRLRHQQPERSICRTGEPTGGDLQRHTWFVPDGCSDPDALRAYQEIKHLIDQAAGVCDQWHKSRRIDDEQWDSIAGHARVILAFADARISTAPTPKSDAIDVDGIAVDDGEEGAQSTIESD